MKNGYVSIEFVKQIENESMFELNTVENRTNEPIFTFGRKADIWPQYKQNFL